MTTIIIKFKPSSLSNDEDTVFFQIIHKRVTRHVLTKYKIFTSEWDCGSKTLRYSADCPAECIKLVQTMNERIRWNKVLLCKGDSLF